MKRSALPPPPLLPSLPPSLPGPPRDVPGRDWLEDGCVGGVVETPLHVRDDVVHGEAVGELAPLAGVRADDFLFQHLEGRVQVGFILTSAWGKEGGREGGREGVVNNRSRGLLTVAVSPFPPSFDLTVPSLPRVRATGGGKGLGPFFS